MVSKYLKKEGKQDGRAGGARATAVAGREKGPTQRLRTSARFPLSVVDSEPLNLVSSCRLYHESLHEDFLLIYSKRGEGVCKGGIF